MADTYHAELVVLVVVGLIGVGLWLWMAQKNKAGKNWARITSTVFFALDTLGAIGGLAGGALSGGSVNRFYGLVVWNHRGGRDHPALAAHVDGVLQERAALTAFPLRRFPSVAYASYMRTPPVTDASAYLGDVDGVGDRSTVLSVA